jgi:hypothetical protein
MLKKYEPKSLLTIAAMLFALISLAGIFFVSVIKLSELGR